MTHIYAFTIYLPFCLTEIGDIFPKTLT